MIRLHNVQRPPGPVEVVGPTPETVRQVRVARHKRGFVGARARNHRGRGTAYVMPGYPIEVPDSWANAPDVVRKVRDRKIRVEHLETAQPAEKPPRRKRR